MRPGELLLAGYRVTVFLDDGLDAADPLSFRNRLDVGDPMLCLANIGKGGFLNDRTLVLTRLGVGWVFACNDHRKAGDP